MMPARRLLDLAVARFRAHLLVYLAACLGVFALAGATDRGWLTWLLLVWGFLLLIHYLVYKTRTVDERWVEERTEELHLKSYDRDHIQKIRKQHGRDDLPGGDPDRR
jgi:hypothetical protein